MEQAGERHRKTIAATAAPLAAVMGCLQPGIDPVFLMMLSQASRLPLSAHGLIVGGTQTGAAIGSLLVWRLGAALPHRAVVLASLMAFACSVATAMTDDVAAMIAVRSCYGLAMGIVYAYAMSAYAARRPTRAFGAVFLIQLIVSTLVSLVLPELERSAGAKVGLSALALAPATAFAALLLLTPPGASHDSETQTSRATVPVAGWALAAANFWFICATMLVWSFAAALALSAGIADRTIGDAVAIGSIAGALTALLVTRERVMVPLPITGLMAGAALVSPILLTAPGADIAFIVSIVLFNIGSTAIIIRCSGLAAATTIDSRFRTFVACTYSLGLIAGPVLGTAMIALLGSGGLFAGVLFSLSAGVGSVMLATVSGYRVSLQKVLPMIDPPNAIALD